MKLLTKTETKEKIPRSDDGLSTGCASALVGVNETGIFTDQHVSIDRHITLYLL